jgi:hypothetical protein
MLRLHIVCNAINHEALRRLRRLEPEATPPGRWKLEVLFYEPGRVQFRSLQDGECRWRFPINRITLALAALLACLGLVDAVSLPHLRNAGRFLRLVVGRAHRLTLLDDGLDQYRSRPRAVDPLLFPAGTSYWLFSDAAGLRAPWCSRFDCRELGPLFPSLGQDSPAAASPYGTLILDSPGVERLQIESDRLPRPWLLALHPVAHKRCWTLPLLPGDGISAGPPEDLIRRFPGLIVAGESMTLLAALRQRPREARLLVTLPHPADSNLERLVCSFAFGDAGVEVV